MPLVVKDRVRQTSSTTGTGTLTLNGTVTGFQSFSVIGNGNTTYYTIVDASAGAWEVGIGTYTASGTTLSRDTVFESSNSNNLVDFGVGAKDVFVTYPAERSVYTDGAGTVITPATASVLGVASGGTGAASLTANNVILGNGTSAVQFVAPGTSGNVLTSDGTTWTSAAAPAGSQTITINNKTGAYTVVAGDLGEIINCTANTFTVSLTAAATLGSGFNCWIWNTGTGAITIDPNASETIDGATTLVLRQNEGTQIVCDGSNWQTGDKKTMRGYTDNIPSTYGKPIASGTGAIALGNRNGDTVFLAQATGIRSFSVNGFATSNYSSAIGQNSSGGGSEASTGAGAMALGGSYASGADSFAAAIANNSNSYGATGANSIAIGYLAKATGADSIAIGDTNTSSAQGAITLGGALNVASASYSLAFGQQASAAIIGKQAFASGQFAAAGDAQSGRFVLRASTTSATPAVMTSDQGAAGATNQVILPNDSTYAFTILVVARRTDADNESAGYEFKGVVDRNGAANTTAIVGTVTKTVLAEDTAAWDVTVTADTTNGGLKVEVTGEAAKTIRWVATCWTSEVTG